MNNWCLLAAKARALSNEGTCGFSNVAALVISGLSLHKNASEAVELDRRNAAS
jgi:hypothetical protein